MLLSEEMQLFQELIEKQNLILSEIFSILNFISLQFNVLFGIVCLFFVLKIIRFLFIEFERSF